MQKKITEICYAKRTVYILNKTDTIQFCVVHVLQFSKTKTSVFGIWQERSKLQYSNLLFEIVQGYGCINMGLVTQNLTVVAISIKIQKNYFFSQNIFNSALLRHHPKDQNYEYISFDVHIITIGCVLCGKKRQKYARSLSFVY